MGQLSQWRYLIPYTCCRTGRGTPNSPQKRRLPAISGVPLARRSVIGFIRVDEKRPEYRQALKPLDEANTSLFPSLHPPSFSLSFFSYTVPAVQRCGRTLSSPSTPSPFLFFAFRGSNMSRRPLRNRSTAWFSTIGPLQASPS